MNARRVEISLQKLLEQDETFSIGMNEEWKNITFRAVCRGGIDRSRRNLHPGRRADGNHRH